MRDYFMYTQLFHCMFIFVTSCFWIVTKNLFPAPWFVIFYKAFSFSQVGEVSQPFTLLLSMETGQWLSFCWTVVLIQTSLVMQDKLLFTSLAGTRDLIHLMFVILIKTSIINSGITGLTVLCYSNRNGNIYIMHKMMQHGADLHIVDEQGKSSLHHAVGGGSV